MAYRFLTFFSGTRVSLITCVIGLRIMAPGLWVSFSQRAKLVAPAASPRNATQKMGW